jgi:glycosyltransferase involved in cell wall biosynthesis
MKIAWLYYGDHLNHPFIRIGIRTLLEQRHAVAVYDVSPQATRSDYRHHRFPMGPGGLGSGSPAYRLAYLRMLTLVSARLIIARPAAVIVTMPHLIPAALTVKHLLGSRIVYYPFEVLGEQTGHVNRFWNMLERVFISTQIDALITQNDRRAEIYRRERRSRLEPVVVHNFNPRAAAVHRTGRLKLLLGLEAHERIVLYEGLLVHGRWLDKLIRSALYLAEGAVLVLMGETTPWWDREGRGLLGDPETNRRVKIAPFVAHEELPEYIADADVGVIIYDDSCRNNYFCEPGKLSDYVRAGIPVVAPDFPTIGATIRRFGIGAAFSSPEPENIAATINRVLATPKQEWVSGLQKAQRELVWETQEQVFLEAVTGVKPGSTPANA